MMKRLLPFLLILVGCSHSHTRIFYDDSLVERLENPRCIHVVFDGKYQDFQVEAVFHPDEETDEVGMATFTFSHWWRKISIDTPYYWPEGFDLKDGPQNGVFLYTGETYHANANADFVQGDESEFAMVYPFFFKDVDFDGQKEICLTHSGYNRTYYSVYKIIGGREAAYMSNPPFNQFVYGYDDTKTTFDYEEKTIVISEQMGCCDAYTDTYVMKDQDDDIMNPMILQEHSEIVVTESGEVIYR